MHGSCLVVLWLWCSLWCVCMCVLSVSMGVIALYFVRLVFRLTYITAGKKKGTVLGRDVYSYSRRESRMQKKGVKEGMDNQLVTTDWRRNGDWPEHACITHYAPQRPSSLFLFLFFSL